GMSSGSIRPLGAGPRLSDPALDGDGASHEHIVVPLVFPVLGGAWYEDWFLKPRGGGRRRHQGQDLMAEKMTPLVACFDGTVSLGRGRGNAGNTITIYGDNGWIAQYYHVNNDTPGTNDGMGGDEHAFAPGLNSGDRVYAGQFIGYVGNSGNAESTKPHLHFELWDSVTRGFINAYHSLRAAQGISEPIAKRAAPEIVPPKGQTRFDGIVQEVDLTKKVVRAKVLSRTENGKTKAVTKTVSVYGRINGKSEIYLLGNDNMPLKLDDLRPGLYAVIVGPTPKAGAAVEVNKAAFAPQ
ncbi:MAG TPA: M23 family metallopeptidase, partial [Fimbriimonadaceae bacterium]|nr:M23 family metallopeptidase [Fimbriimonadaceae bacterium]